MLILIYKLTSTIVSAEANEISQAFLDKTPDAVLWRVKRFNECSVSF